MSYFMLVYSIKIILHKSQYTTIYKAGSILGLASGLLFVFLSGQNFEISKVQRGDHLVIQERFSFITIRSFYVTADCENHSFKFKRSLFISQVEYGECSFKYLNSFGNFISFYGVEDALKERESIKLENSKNKTQ